MKMGKSCRFNSGDLVSGKKWNGEHFIGVYEHKYDCGDHAIFDGKKHFCVHKKDCHLASEEETKVIKKTIVSVMKNADKAAKKPKKEPTNEKELSEDEIEKLLTEE